MIHNSDITKLLQLRQARRRRLGQLSFEEKIEIVERLRELQFNRDLMSAHRVNSEGAVEVKGEARSLSR